MTIIYKIDKMPDCKTCGKTMSYWIPGMPIENHEHDECFITRTVDELLQPFRDTLKGGDE